MTFTAFTGGNAFDIGPDTININGAGGYEKLRAPTLRDHLGGAGDDVLTGGTGNDTFLYASTTDAVAGGTSLKPPVAELPILYARPPRLT